MRAYARVRVPRPHAQGEAGLGGAWLGGARHGEAGHGMDSQLNRSVDGLMRGFDSRAAHATRRGRARHGLAWRGWARQGIK